MSTNTISGKSNEFTNLKKGYSGILPLTNDHSNEVVARPPKTSLRSSSTT